MSKKLNKVLLLFILLPCIFLFSSCGKKNQVLTYEINYILNGGENSSENPTSYTNESEVIVLLSPSRENYDFLGWYTDENFENSITQIEKGESGNKTLYAKWSATEFSINYVLYGGTNNVDNPSSYTIESDTIQLLDPTFDNYEFEGWYLESNFTNKINQISSGSTGEVTVYAKWKDITFNINYELNGGVNNENNPSVYLSTSETITLLEPSKDGYIFDGWYTSNTYDSVVTEITSGSVGDMTLYAKWSAISYNIKYELDGGENSSENPSTYTIETDTIKFLSPSKVGYEFVSWKLDLNSDETITELGTGSTGDKTLYAVWSAKSYTVYLDYDGADNNNEVSSLSVVYDTEIGTLPTPEKTGYEFAGWWRNSVKYEETFVYNFDEDITLTAKWNSIAVVVTYSVVFDSNGGSQISSITDITFGEKIEEPTSPVKTGYTFQYWTLNENEWDFNVNAVTEDITLVAVWKINEYSIKYNLDGGENNDDNPTSYTIETGTITLSSPTKEGYDFLGWFEDSSFETLITEINSSSLKNYELYASWAERPVTKSTADISVVYDLPEQLSSLYNDSTNTASVGSMFELQSFNGLNIKNYFLGYYYYNSNNETINIEGSYYSVDTSDDITIYASWDTTSLLKYYYTDGIAFEISNETAVVSYYSGSSSTIYLPEYYNYNGTDYVVSYIGEGSFRENYTISKVVFLPRTYTIGIKEYAFYNSSLTSFDFSYVSTISKYAFYGTGISELVSTSNMISIGNYSFASCLNLTKLDLTSTSNSFSLIPEGAFSGCTSLSTIFVSSKLNTINRYAFSNCSSLTNLNFLEQMGNYSYIGSEVFSYCTGLTSIKIPTQISSVGSSIFYGCTNINTVELTNILGSDSYFSSVFSVSNIENLILGGTDLTSIPKNYFRELSTLKTVYMTDNIVTIGEYAFKNCTNLLDIYFSSSLDLDTFNINAFYGTAWFEQIDDLYIINDVLIYIPESEELTDIVIPSGVTKIASGVASENSYITSLYIPATVKVISSYSFDSCYYLTSVIFEENSLLEEISSYAFYSCFYLTDISLENCNNLKTIGDYAFTSVGFSVSDSYLGGTDGFYIPSSVTSIGEGVFRNVKIYSYVSNGDVYVSDENGILYEIDEDENKIAIVAVPKSFSSEFYIIPSTIKRIYAYAMNSNSNIDYCYINHSVELGLNAFNSMTYLLVGDNATITFTEINGSKKSYLVTQLDSSEYECYYSDGNYTITVSSELEDNFYCIKYNETTLLIYVSGGEASSNALDITAYVDLM